VLEENLALCTRGEGEGEVQCRSPEVWLSPGVEKELVVFCQCYQQLPTCLMSRSWLGGPVSMPFFEQPLTAPGTRSACVVA
jgi:hypothetical protein